MVHGQGEAKLTSMFLYLFAASCVLMREIREFQAAYIQMP
jgi:hypothetical protein